MKIGIFAYNFEHKKTQEGIFNLYLNNIPITAIFAADPVNLNFYKSKIRVSPRDLKYTHPKEIATRLGIPYHVIIHNSQECRELIKKYDLDVGIILGARIIKDHIIESFKIGIINMHPGLLPQNRGLDNLKWAIIHGYRQGVTTHLINKFIDKGKMILKEEINIYKDDTLVDIFLRLQDLEQQLLIKSLKILKEGKKEFEIIPEGNYYRSVPPDIEATLMEKFEEYKKKFAVKE